MNHPKPCDLRAFVKIIWPDPHRRARANIRRKGGRRVEHHLDAGRVGHFGDHAALGDEAARSDLHIAHHARDRAGHVEPS